MGQSICTAPRVVGRWYVADTSLPLRPFTSTVTSARRTAERTLSRVSFRSSSLTETVLPSHSLTGCASPTRRSTTRTRGDRGAPGGRGPASVGWRPTAHSIRPATGAHVRRVQPGECFVTVVPSLQEQPSVIVAAALLPAPRRRGRTPRP